MRFAQKHYMNICSYDQVGRRVVGWFWDIRIRHFVQNIGGKIFIIVQNAETRPLTPASGTPKREVGLSPHFFILSPHSD